MEGWRTEADLVAARERFEASIPGYVAPHAYGVGVATVAPSGTVLDVWYPHVNTDDHPLPAVVMASVCGYRSGTSTHVLDTSDLERAAELLAPAEACETVDHPNLQTWRGLLGLARAGDPPGGMRQFVAMFLGDVTDPLVGTCDAYFRLHLLSHRLARPNGVNVDGIFGHLANVVWTDAGPFEPEDFRNRRLELAAAGRATRVLSVDKFPRMVDYVTPSGVRIADGDRVRLGAHLAEGTVVMHEGYCNYNAGTLGPAMIEGRISAGVTVGPDSDIGGGASLMGTLSGGGTERITVGRGCLIGANGGVGISLGDNCTVEAGLYVTAGTVVRLPDKSTTKARELSGRPNLLFRRHSLTGEVQAVPNQGVTWAGLNPDLHT